MTHNKLFYFILFLILNNSIISGNQIRIQYIRETQLLRITPQRPDNPIARSLDQLEENLKNPTDDHPFELPEEQLVILMALMDYACEQ
ncbi:MAG: hypothetical protein K2X90_01950 [Candidatus Babeliaceae bacterium]|nr:hypothetical protein [Candidatus Babeliaceae bacterium]